MFACLAPQRAFSAQERECCRRMPPMCGSAKMPSSHSCCKTQRSSSGAMAVTAGHRPGPAPRLVSLIVLSPWQQVSQGFLGNVLHHPPSEARAGTTVLRI